MSETPARSRRSPRETAKTKAGRETRQARLAAAMRRNLTRRKAQKRAREAAERAPDG